MDEPARIQACFQAFLEGSLITHDIDAVLDLFTEDAIGIGMGAQGIVRRKKDLRPILLNTRSGVDNTHTEIQYSNLQIRYYGDDYAGICATVTITTQARGERRRSHSGQCAGLRKVAGEWKINMVQATPLSIDIQEIDAYPLSFAEDEIETYRMQEQFSSVMQRNRIATYKVDFEEGLVEDYLPTQAYSPPAQPGDRYESKLLLAAGDLPDGKGRLQYLETFSVDSLAQAYQGGQTDVAMDYEAIQPDGQLRWRRGRVHLFTDIRGHLKGYFYLFDIDSQKRQELLLTHQAELDLATGVYNKETARKKIQLALDLYDMPMTGAFFMIDLDNFKQINDTHGHIAGDFVIQQTAQVLKAAFRESDVIGRLGGDEFCVFDTGDNNVRRLARRAETICQAVRAIRPAGEAWTGTSVSIGIARREDAEDFDQLYQRADQALYQRKLTQGRDGFAIWSAQPDSPGDTVSAGHKGEEPLHAV